MGFMPSVETRELSDGSVRRFVRVRDPRTKKQTSRTFATQPEAEAFCRDVDQRGVAWALTQLDLDLEAASEPTLDEWAVIHFRALTKPSRETVGRYRHIYKTHWSPHLGHMRLSTIARTDVAAALLQVPGKDKTVLNAWGVLTHMLKMAARDGLIPASPTIGVDPPRRTSHEDIEHRYLSREEFDAVLNATPEHWQPLILTLAGTAIRYGEAAALTVGDIDVQAATMKVTKAEKRDPDNPSRTIIGPPKSKKSRRTVTLPMAVVDILEPLLDRPRTARLFLPPKGGPLRHRTLYRDIWQRIVLPNSGIDRPYPRLHDLRHSHVAWLIAAGTPLPVIQQRLGHEKITTTIDTYGHLMPDIQRAAAEAADAVFSRPQVSVASTRALPGEDA